MSAPVTCPNCSSSFDASESIADEDELICPACMHAFVPPMPGEAGVPDALFADLKGPRGESLGTLDRYAVRQLIYAGSLKGREQVKIAGGGWEPIGARPEFAEVFQLIGVDLGSLRISEQQVKGWRKTDAVLANEQREAAERRAAARAAEPVRAPKKAPMKVEDGMKIAGGLIGVMFVIAGGYAAWVYLL